MKLNWNFFSESLLFSFSDQENGENFDSERTQVFSNGSLVINNIKKSDEGSYSCSISNNIGKDIHKLVTLTVIGKMKP